MKKNNQRGNKHMKKIFFILVGIFFLNFVCSMENLGTFPQYSCVNLKQSCANCSYVNLTTIDNPNSNQIIIGGYMTKRDTQYNYTYCGFEKTGTYIINGFADPEGVKKIWNYELKITSSGEDDISILENSLVIFLVFLALIFLILGVKLNQIIFGFIASILFILAGMRVMIYGFSNVSNLYTQGAALTLLGIGIIIMFVSAFEWINWGGDTEE